MKNNCIFCAITAGEIPSFKIYEDELVLAFLDINPFATGHVLVVPKNHSEGLLDTDDETLAAVITRVKKVAEHIKNVLPADGFNILQAIAGRYTGTKTWGTDIHCVCTMVDGGHSTCQVFSRCQ